MKFIPTSLAGLYVIDLEPVFDSRGWFARTYCQNDFAEIGHKKEWVQMNHSFTGKKGTIRGMHYQMPPVSEIKMVRCIAGSVMDIVIDLRKKSETFLGWERFELNYANKRMIYIPEGFAHGFQSLTDNCEMLYHHTAFYAPGSEAGIRYDDPLVNVRWPLPVGEISDRDSSHLFLNHGFKGLDV